MAREKVHYMNTYAGIREVIKDLLRASDEGKLKDVALVFRREPFDDENKVSEDGRTIHSVTARHFYADKYVAMVRGMIQSLDDYIRETQDQELEEGDDWERER